jgi:hypothetical protein
VNPSYIQTPPDETVIWRYMETVKFFDLIQTGELFFSRLDHQQDQREGTLPNAVIEADPFIEESAPIIAATVRECVCVNCWFMGDRESQQMWDKFAGCGGVALKSTIGRLKEAFAGAAGEQFIGQVEYINFDNGVCSRDGRDLTAAICNKDGSFTHENEVRALVITQDDGTPGQRVRVDLTKLIDAVVVGPTPSDLILSVVKRELTEHNVDVRVRHSQINTGRAYPSPTGLGTGYRAEYGYMDLNVINEQQGRWRVLLFDAKRNTQIHSDKPFEDEASAKACAEADALHYVTSYKSDPPPYSSDAIDWEVLA